MDEKNELLKNDKENKDKVKKNLYEKFDSIMDLTNVVQTKKKFFVDEDSIINLNPRNIKKDIIIFKEEILTELNQFKKKIFDKNKKDENYMNDTLEKFGLQIKRFSEKIIELSNLICTDNSIRDKINTISQFKNKAQEIIMTNGIRIDNLDKEFHDNIYRVDNILKDTVLYPGVIGGISRFKNFHNFMDYVLTELSQGITFREKTSLDLNNIKAKLENYMLNISLKMDNVSKSSNNYADNCVKNLEKKFNSTFDIYNDKLTNIRMENTKYAEDIKKATEELLKQINFVISLKNELLNKFDDQVNFMKKENVRIIKCFSGYKKEFYEIKEKFKDISNFTKDVRLKLKSKEIFNKKDCNNIDSKKIKDTKKYGKYVGNKEVDFLEKNLCNYNPKRRNSVNYPKRINIGNLIIKDDNNEGENKNKYNFSNKEVDKIIKRGETVYEQFLREYQKIDYEKENPLSLKKEKNKSKHHHHNHQHHNHQYKRNEKSYSTSISISDESENFNLRRKNKFFTISSSNNKLSIPIFKLLNEMNNNKDNNNKGNKNNKNIVQNKIRNNSKRTKSLKINKMKVINKIKKLKNMFINSPSNSKSNASKNRSNKSNNSKNSSNSSFSSSNSSDERSNSSGNKKSYKHKKIQKNKNNNTIKELDENINNTNSDYLKTKSNSKKIRNQKAEIIISNFSKEEDAKKENKSIKNDNKTDDLKLEQILITQIKRNAKTEKNFTFIPKEKIESNIINQNLDKDEQFFFKNNSNTINIGQFSKTLNKFYDMKSYNNKKKNFLLYEPIKKISLTIEGSNKLEIKPNLKENNKFEKNVISNVKNIINNNNKNYMSNTNYNGFPKIVTNNGERIITPVHPIFNSKKFVTYTSPNIAALNKSIQILYGNKFKNKYQTNVKNLLSNKSDFTVKNNQITNNILLKNQNNNNDYEMYMNNLKENNKFNYRSEERLKPVFNHTRNNLLYNNQNFSQNKSKDENKYYNLMVNMDKRK